MKSDYTINPMSEEELAVAIEWARLEGWNPGLYDKTCFYSADPKGFFAGKMNQQIIAVGSAVIYSDAFAFCGFYIVDKPYRDHGYGLALTKERLRYVGSRNAGIDGVVDMLDKYEKIGYRRAHANARYRGNFIPASTPSNHMVSLKDIDFRQLTAFDRIHFPAPRSAFLACWINQPGAKSIGYIDEEGLKGYGVIRPCYEGFKIGPLFAGTPKIAEQLFLSLASFAGSKPYYLDIPENNPEAIALVKRFSMDKVFETARMYLKGVPSIKHQSIYGITSFELG